MGRKTDEQLFLPYDTIKHYLIYFPKNNSVVVLAKINKIIQKNIDTYKMNKPDKAGNRNAVTSKQFSINMISSIQQRQMNSLKRSTDGNLDK